MVFNSVVFLFCFLPLALLAYYLVPGRGKNVVLLVEGLLPAVAVLVNLAALVYFKYANFLIDTLNRIGNFGLAALDVGAVLPLGISYYIFKIISYEADVYTGKVEAEKDPIAFAAYVLFFPQLIVGPIIKYRDMAPLLNMFLVWAATGIWHGANWNFIVWGLYYFVLLVIEKNFLLKFLKKCPLAAHIYTLFFVVLGWGIFTANQPGAPLGLLLNKLFVPQGGISPVYYLRNYGVFLVLGCVCSSVLPRWLWERISRNTAVKAVVSALLALLCIAYVVAATNTTALYANF